ncbi:MAG: hypothetical protein ACTHNT_05175 [Actinomycetales bacterium]
MLATAHLILAAAYLGFQVTIRVLVYPQFAAVDAGSFARYERRHQRLVSCVVGPLFAGLALTTCGVLVLDGAPGAPSAPGALGVAAAVLFAALLAVTAFGAVPQHRVLDNGFDAAAHRRLLTWDTARVVLAAGNLVVAAALAAA